MDIGLPHRGFGALDDDSVGVPVVFGGGVANPDHLSWTIIDDLNFST
jgi:hypothetical protein